MERHFFFSRPLSYIPRFLRRIDDRRSREYSNLNEVRLPLMRISIEIQWGPVLHARMHAGLRGEARWKRMRKRDATVLLPVMPGPVPTVSSLHAYVHARARRIKIEARTAEYCVGSSRVRDAPAPLDLAFETTKYTGFLFLQAR